MGNPALPDPCHWAPYASSLRGPRASAVAARGLDPPARDVLENHLVPEGGSRTQTPFTRIPNHQGGAK